MAECSTTLEYDIEEEMMERLKRRINGVVVYIGTNNPYMNGQIPCEVEPAGVREMMYRLAAYEDTGLTPEEVISMHGEWRAMMSVLNSIGGGYTRLRELAEADKDGRLVVLPCKVGDKLYRVFDGNISEHEVQNMKYFARQRRLGIDMTPFFPDAEKFIGKTVFLTREEAEKAMEATKDD